MSNNKADKSIDEQAFEALEDALALDDTDLSSEELEAQVSAAARELAEAQENDAPAAEERKTEKADKSARATPPYTPAGPFAPANDDSRKTPAALLRAFEIRSSRGAIRNAVLLSLLWTIGCLGIANLLYGPAIWQIRSLNQLLAMPAAIGVLVAIVIPIFVFFGFAIMMARAREMRTAARASRRAGNRRRRPDHDRRPGRAP